MDPFKTNSLKVHKTTVMIVKNIIYLINIFFSPLQKKKKYFDKFLNQIKF